MSTAAKDVARRIIDKANRAGAKAGLSHQLAQVIQADPLRVELMDSSLVMEEDEIKVTQHVRQYHADWGIDPGDNIVMHKVSGRWVATSVISDKPVS